jgi:hypothetical protein
MYFLKSIAGVLSGINIEFRTRSTIIGHSVLHFTLRSSLEGPLTFSRLVLRSMGTGYECRAAKITLDHHSPRLSSSRYFYISVAPFGPTYKTIGGVLT